MKMLISIVCIVAGIGIFFGFTNPRYEGIKVLRAEEEVYDDALLSKFNSFPTERLERLETLLPDTIDTVRLIIDINSIASRHNLSLLNISVGDAGPSQDIPEGALGPSGEMVGTITLSFGMSATYEELRAFLFDVERSLRLIDVVNLSFNAANTADGRTPYAVTIETYWLK